MTTLARKKTMAGILAGFAAAVNQNDPPASHRGRVNRARRIDNMFDWRGMRHHLLVPAPGALAASAAIALTVIAIGSPEAAEPVRIAVFDFELNDRSAGGGVIGQDPVDTESLELSTEEARRLLSESGRYSVVDTAGAAGEVDPAGGIRSCNGCEADLARRLGADQSMLGIVARVSRTEYTLQIVVRDAETGDVLSNDFTGLRMGANYAWPRGARWLMKNRILSAQRAE